MPKPTSPPKRSISDPRLAKRKPHPLSVNKHHRSVMSRPVAVDLKGLQAIVKTVKKAMGKAAGVGIPSSADLSKMEFVSCGVQAIDDVFTADMDRKDGSRFIVGTGRGLPRGRIVEIFGPEAGSKTTIALLFLAVAQRLGLKCAFMDVEHALSFPHARSLGVDPEAMIYDDPETAEEAIAKTTALVEAGIDVLVFDSVAAAMPEQEQEMKNGKPKTTPGKQAALMSQALRRLAGLASKKNTLLIFINQTRMKIGVMFGNPETTSGGNALKFYASIRARVVKIQALKKGGRKAGVRVKLVVQKNKIVPPFREVVFDIVFGKGVVVPDAKSSTEDEPEGEDADE